MVQVPIDLSPHAGKTVNVKIEFTVKTDRTSYEWVRIAVDDILLVSKSS